VKSSTAPKAKKNFGTARMADAAILYCSEEIAISCCLESEEGSPKTKGWLSHKKTKGRDSSIGIVGPVPLLKKTL
jgi:hypothetical protein